MTSPATGPVAVVLGGSRGLGYLIAADLLGRGHRVVIAARDEVELDAAVEKLSPLGDVSAARCDVTIPDDVERLVDDVESDLGPIEVAVHVAGIIQVGPWQATRREHFAACIDVMLYGPIHLALSLLPRMTERGHGRFCVITSVGGRISPPRLVPYSVAKFGALGLVEGLAAELAGTGVTATAAIPGIMRTGSHGAATYFGDATKQYNWFASVASSRLTSVDGARAAREIVDGTLAGKPLVHVGLTARLGSLVHGIMPSTTIRALGLTSRLLPTGDDPVPVTGDLARQGSSSRIVAFLTRTADRAARRTNQHAGSGQEETAR